MLILAYANVWIRIEMIFNLTSLFAYFQHFIFTRFAICLKRILIKILTRKHQRSNQQINLAWKSLLLLGWNYLLAIKPAVPVRHPPNRRGECCFAYVLRDGGGDNSNQNLCGAVGIAHRPQNFILPGGVIKLNFK